MIFPYKRIDELSIQNIVFFLSRFHSELCEYYFENGSDTEYVFLSKTLCLHTYLLSPADTKSEQSDFELFNIS